VNPLALSLALLLGQSEPAAPPAEATAPAPAVQEAGPAAAPAIPAAAPALRELRLTRLPGGAFGATLGGEPVERAGFYRAVLRPDLAERLEARDHARAFALVAAGSAAVGGPALGWLAYHARRREVPGCAAPGDGVACRELARQIAARNHASEQRGLTVGGVAGAGAAGLALWWWAAHPPLDPTLDEAEALVEAYRARRGDPAPPPEVGLQLTWGGALLVLRLAR
jgi:hypothetical protein